MSTVYLLQLFTGAHTQGIYSSLELAIAACCAHCAAMDVPVAPVFKQQFPTVWYAPNAEDVVTDISITAIKVNTPVPFV